QRSTEVVQRLARIRQDRRGVDEPEAAVRVGERRVERQGPLIEHHGPPRVAALGQDVAEEIGRPRGGGIGTDRETELALRGQEIGASHRDLPQSPPYLGKLRVYRRGAF